MKKTIIFVLIGIVLGFTISALIPDSHDKANECTVYGTFDEDTFVNLEGKQYYRFKSYDNEVWWCFEMDELDFVPKADITYALTYDNKGTTKENKPCDCAPEYECECEVYDDEFVCIEEVQ